MNSLQCKIFNPLNSLIQLNKSMNYLMKSSNEFAEKNARMIGICLQQLVFTTQNIFEMSKIRQNKFKKNFKEINVADKIK